jgi:hypothetical protein
MQVSNLAIKEKEIYRSLGLKMVDGNDIIRTMEMAMIIKKTASCQQPFFYQINNTPKEILSKRNFSSICRLH